MISDPEGGERDHHPAKGRAGSLQSGVGDGTRVQHQKSHKYYFENSDMGTAHLPRVQDSVAVGFAVEIPTDTHAVGQRLPSDNGQYKIANCQHRQGDQLSARDHDVTSWRESRRPAPRRGGDSGDRLPLVHRLVNRPGIDIRPDDECQQAVKEDDQCGPDRHHASPQAKPPVHGPPEIRRPIGWCVPRRRRF